MEFLEWLQTELFPYLGENWGWFAGTGITVVTSIITFVKVIKVKLAEGKWVKIRKELTEYMEKLDVNSTADGLTKKEMALSWIREKCNAYKVAYNKDKANEMIEEKITVSKSKINS